MDCLSRAKERRASSVGFPLNSLLNSFIACTSIEIDCAKILKESDVEFIEIKATKTLQRLFHEPTEFPPLLLSNVMTHPIYMRHKLY